MAIQDTACCLKEKRRKLSIFVLCSVACNGICEKLPLLHYEYLVYGVWKTDMHGHLFIYTFIWDKILPCPKKLTFCDVILAFIVIVQHVGFSIAAPDFIILKNLFKWNIKTAPKEA